MKNGVSKKSNGLMAGMAALAVAGALETSAHSADILIAMGIAKANIQAAARDPRVEVDPGWRIVINNVSRAFDRAKFLEATPGFTWEQCDEKQRVLAYVFRGGTEVYICPLQSKQGNDHMAQTLIHESTHVSGNYDECKTTEVELSITTLAGKQPYRNGYVKRCGFDGRFDFRGDSADWGVDAQPSGKAPSDWGVEQKPR